MALSKLVDHGADRGQRLIVLHPSAADKLELPRGHQALHECPLRRAQLSEPLRKEACLSPRKRPIRMSLQCLDDPVEDATRTARVAHVCVEPAGIGVAVWYQMDVEDHGYRPAAAQAPGARLVGQKLCKFTYGTGERHTRQVVHFIVQRTNERTNIG